jgi:hypothetical protein
MAASSIQVRTGRYKQGGTTEFTPSTVKWWDRRAFSTAVDDIPFTITPTYISRPDLIAYEVYGRANLMWLVLQYNNIVDINEELVEGRVLKLPSVRRLQTEILTKS